MGVTWRVNKECFGCEATMRSCCRKSYRAAQWHNSDLMQSLHEQGESLPELPGKMGGLGDAYQASYGLISAISSSTSCRVGRGS